jgi:hypothetical protein
MSVPTVRLRRAVLRNALTWAVAWAALGGALVAGVAVFDPDPTIESLPERLGLALMAGVAWGVRFGVMGAAIGALFAGLVRLGYRGRRLADLRPLPFAVLGAAVGGIGVPLVLQAMNVLSGGAIAWHLVLDDAPWAAAFGALAAAGGIALARRADALPPGPEHAALAAPGAREALPPAQEPAAAAR